MLSSCPISSHRILEQLGSGQFGKVCKALWTVDGHTLGLAVKTLKPGASVEDKVKFLQEAAIMGQFNHSNVIKMYGIITLGEPVSISPNTLHIAYGWYYLLMGTIFLEVSYLVDLSGTQFS